MTVIVADRVLRTVSDLSAPSRLVLAFIDGGMEWLDWAARDPVARYAFPDETHLVGEVQRGLHGAPYALLPRLGLLVAPAKLMTLGMEELRTLAHVESGLDDDLVLRHAEATMAAHALLTQRQLAAVPAFLQSLGVGGQPVFQALELQELRVLHGLIDLPTLAGDGHVDLRGGAAAFAAEQARTPTEFADYYRFYLAQIANLKAWNLSAEERRQRAEATMTTLLPLMFGALDCPQVDGLVSPAEVARAITDWLRRGNRLGFARLSEGVCRIAEDTVLTIETGVAARHLVDAYLSSAQSFLTAHAPTRGLMGQDGATCLFPVTDGTTQAEVQLGATGTITLRQFRRTPPKS
ncbi:hypothetical protein [Nitrospirillum sp. BR 11163]|uniref:hypothetical protein n=1 Tax=Nitrospirillum sp. BR 11163 TaxID=3104323 RepID=UPI002AFE3A76|nr:hypothetical protein [Nitrospirillum sp. BR 11163]MEA1672209.1 hypothetical protein [Nitrospirillum sp. BR 11163]